MTKKRDKILIERVAFNPNSAFKYVGVLCNLVNGGYT